jgi:hypothetical protein
MKLPERAFYFSEKPGYIIIESSKKLMRGFKTQIYKEEENERKKII